MLGDQSIGLPRSRHIISWSRPAPLTSQGLQRVVQNWSTSAPLTQTLRAAPLTSQALQRVLQRVVQNWSTPVCKYKFDQALHSPTDFDRQA